MPVQLTQRYAERAKPGRHTGANGLVLRVRTKSSGEIQKNWEVRRLRPGTKTYDTRVIGRFPTMNFNSATKLAAEIKHSCDNGIPFVDALKRATTNAKYVPGLKAPMRNDDVPTWAEVAEEFVSAKERTWKGNSRSQTFRRIMRKWVNPTMGNKPIDLITTDDILIVLDRLWTEVPPTARKAEQFICAVLMLGRRNKYITGPLITTIADIKGLRPTDAVMPRATPRAAIGYEDAPELARKLWNKQTVGSLCTLFTLLTACRVDSTTGMRWDEINDKKGYWRVSNERIKGGLTEDNTIDIPLTKQMRAILAVRRLSTQGTYVFDGSADNTHVDKETPRKALIDLGHGPNGPLEQCTAHGLRSCFKTWASEKYEVDEAGTITVQNRSACEAQLSHKLSSVEGQVPAVYLRTKYYEPRKRMLTAWSDFLLPSDGAA